MEKKYAKIVNEAIKNLNDKEWKAESDGKIYWDYISKTKPAFEVFVGKEIQDEDGTSTRVFAIDNTMDEVTKYTYAGTDRLLCDYLTIEDALYALTKSLVKKAKYLY